MWFGRAFGGRIRHVGCSGDESSSTSEDDVPTGDEFVRDTKYIATRITREGRDGYPVEPGRYRLVVSRACPWANRAVIVRRLLGLENAISLAMCGPTHDRRSWTFDLDPNGVDPVLGYERLQQAYFARFPDYDRGITVPAIVDVLSKAVVTNDYKQMTWTSRPNGRSFTVPARPTSTPRRCAQRWTR